METVKEIQKRQYKTDGLAYLLNDSGCELASQYLGRPSRCLECPFGKCIMDTIPEQIRAHKSLKQKRRQAGKKGGQVTLDRYGKDHFVKLGARGGRLRAKTLSSLSASG